MSCALDDIFRSHPFAFRLTLNELCTCMPVDKPACQSCAVTVVISVAAIYASGAFRFCYSFDFRCCCLSSFQKQLWSTFCFIVSAALVELCAGERIAHSECDQRVALQRGYCLAWVARLLDVRANGYRTELVFHIHRGLRFHALHPSIFTVEGFVEGFMRCTRAFLQEARVSLESVGCVTAAPAPSPQ